MYAMKKATINNFEHIKLLKTKLQQDIFGQDEAVDSVANKLAIHAAGLGDENKPIGSFLFTGPTGVGKTELAKSLAKHLKMHFERFDMSEFTSERSIDNLIGGAAGLVGYDKGGLLTNAIKENPKSVVLFDEIEKADLKVLNVFLQILDYATLTSTKGDKVSFEDCIIIFTSNLGAISYSKRTAGFQSASYKEKENSAEEYLTPELRARINTHIDFKPLGEAQSKLIIGKYLKSIEQKLRNLNVSLRFSDDIYDFILSLNTENLGARNIHNIIEKTIKTKISQAVLNGELRTNSEANITVANDSIAIELIKNDAQKKYDFETAIEAQAYARVNIGACISRSPCGEGYVITKRNKSSIQNSEWDLPF